jgi:HK97 family phage major capsid protein
MVSIKQLEDQGRALLAQQKALIDDTRRPWSVKSPQFDRLQGDIDAVLEQHAALKSVSHIAVPWDAGNALGHNSSGGGRLSGMQAGIAGKGYPRIGTPQLDLSDEQTRELYDAAIGHKTLSIQAKAADTSTNITPAGIPDFRLPPVTLRREPTRVLSLLPTFGTNSAMVEWFSTTGTTAAAAVAEGGAKPQSHIAYAAQTTAATKIAHYVEATDETFQDFGGFLSVLEADMIAGLILAENNELLNATFAGASKFPGLLNTTGILTLAAAADTNLDAISKAFDSLRIGTSYTEPDGIVMHPTTWGSITRAKDTQGRYQVQPDPTAGANHSLWGVPVVLTTQIAAGTALLGAFAESVAVYVREGIRVETANQGTAQFTANTQLVRCEERLILTVPRPSGLLKITGLA